MKCVDREKLFRYLHQMLEPDEADQVRRHVTGCDDCARVAEDYRRLDLALDDWTAAEPSPWFDAKVLARVGANENRNSGFLGFGRVRMLAAAIAAMALIIVAVVVFNHQKVAEINQPASIQQRPVAVTAPTQVPDKIEALKKPLPAEEQLKMDENLSLLEDYEVVANFDALSELPQANAN